jgi:hypothetical protein
MSLATMSCHFVSIYVETTTKSPLGGKPVTMKLLNSNIQCRVEKIRPDISAIIYAKFDTTMTYRVYFTQDYGLSVKNRLVYNNNYYQVIAVNNVSNLGRLWQVDVEKKPSWLPPPDSLQQSAEATIVIDENTGTRIR